VKIEDVLFEARSRHANTFPAWYADHFRVLGLADLHSDAAREFFEGELESGVFDRVVHAYYILSRSRFPLLVGDSPTPLWSKMLAVAQLDPENRYWISLALAESKMLPAHLYTRRRTSMASETESLQERIALNAEALDARIYRVLGVTEGDVNVSHLPIVYAQRAAWRRVREQELESLGGSAAYQAITGELERMETGEFESGRFLEIMEEDLPFLLARFGSPPDPAAILETLRVLCRGPGQNRMRLWDAADSVAAHYEPLIAGGQVEAEPPPRPDAAAVIAMGEGAAGYLAAILADAADPAAIQQVFEADLIPAVVAEHPPRDPAALRAAVRHAYYTLGYPPALRDAYLRAIESLGPEESEQAAVSNATVDALRGAFSQAEDPDAFSRAFEAFRRASSEGRVPRRDADPAFVAAFAGAAIRLLESEQRAIASAEQGAAEASAARAAAAAAIEEAEAAVDDASRVIREASEWIASEEARQQAALLARNEAVIALNESVERANAAPPGPEGESARLDAQRLEAELGAAITRYEQELETAESVLREAEALAESELERARREEARAVSEAERENAALEAEREAETEVEKRRARFADVLARLIVGLGFVGIEGDPASVGDPAADPNVRLAGLALLLDAEPDETPPADALERETQGGDEALKKLAALVLAQGAP
jgi:hypothetical protein